MFCLNPYRWNGVETLADQKVRKMIGLAIPCAEILNVGSLGKQMSFTEFKVTLKYQITHAELFFAIIFHVSVHCQEHNEKHK